MTPLPSRILSAALTWLALACAAHAQPHQHGNVTLDIAVDARTITVLLTAPLDSLVGFERPPRNDAERRQVTAALDKLRAADALLSIDPAAECRVANLEIRSAVLGLGTSVASTSADGHAEIEATFEFACAAASQARHLEAGLFQAFAGLKQIEAQVAGARGQSRQRLPRPARRIELAR